MGEENREMEGRRVTREEKRERGSVDERVGLLRRGGEC